MWQGFAAQAAGGGAGGGMSSSSAVSGDEKHELSFGGIQGGFNVNRGIPAELLIAGAVLVVLVVLVGMRKGGR